MIKLHLNVHATSGVSLWNFKQDFNSRLLNCIYLKFGFEKSFTRQFCNREDRKLRFRGFINCLHAEMKEYECVMDQRTKQPSFLQQISNHTIMSKICKRRNHEPYQQISRHTRELRFTHSRAKISLLTKARMKNGPIMHHAESLGASHNA